MKIIDERQTKKRDKNKKQKQKIAKGAEAIVKVSELDDFVVHLS